MYSIKNLFRDPRVIVSPESLNKSMEANEIGQIVDLRSQEEYLQGHIKGAIHIAANELELKIGSLIPVKTSRIFCYCQDGEKSYQMVKKLRELGYQLAFSIDGGIKAWMAKGLTISR